MVYKVRIWQRKSWVFALKSSLKPGSVGKSWAVRKYSRQISFDTLATKQRISLTVRKFPQIQLSYSLDLKWT